jgi:hypothetical protein
LTEEREENRRAILQLYQTFLTRHAAALVGLAVIFLAEFQIFLASSIAFKVLVGFFMLGTVAVMFLSWETLYYWNRRIQTVMTTPVPSIVDQPNQDSLIVLDDFYGRTHNQNEQSRWDWWITRNFIIGRHPIVRRLTMR